MSRLGNKQNNSPAAAGLCGILFIALGISAIITLAGVVASVSGTTPLISTLGGVGIGVGGSGFLIALAGINLFFKDL